MKKNSQTPTPYDLYERLQEELRKNEPDLNEEKIPRLEIVKDEKDLVNALTDAAKAILITLNHYNEL